MCIKKTKKKYCENLESKQRERKRKNVYRNFFDPIVSEHHFFRSISSHLRASMGVPGFAPWLTHRHSNIVLNRLSKSTAGLYVDVNGVIHPMCHGDGVDNLPEAEKIENILSFFNQLVVLAQPTEVLYLAVDGVAPAAKMNQQRARRYMSKAHCIDNQDTQSVMREDENVSHFDNNSISPGTEFMDHITKAMNIFIREKMEQNDPLWTKLSVIVSDSNVPSEGEHKIIRFLRAQSSSPEFFAKSHVILGLDADLIFLSLSLHVPNIFIMRQMPNDKRMDRRSGKCDFLKLENDPKSPKFQFFCVDTIGMEIVSDIFDLCCAKNFRYHQVEAFTSEEVLGFSIDSPKKNESDTEVLRNFHPCISQTNSKIIDDFIVLAFFVGNDFMPRLPSAYCDKGALDNLLECYVDDVLPYGYLTLPNGCICMQQLCRLLSSYHTYYETRLFMEVQMKNYDTLCSDEKRSGFESVKKTYYKSAGLSSSIDIDRSCQAYLDTAQFVWTYYSTLQPPNWVWCYPFHYAPFASDLAKYLQKQKCFVPHPSFSASSKPCEKFVQLLSILPPTSAALLPAACRSLLVPSPENAHVSSEWQVDFTGAGNRDHLAKILLPFTDIRKIKDRFASIKDVLSPAEIELNENRKYHLVYYCTLKSDRKTLPTEPETESSCSCKSVDTSESALENSAHQAEKDVIYFATNSESRPPAFRFRGKRIPGESLLNGDVHCDQYVEESLPFFQPTRRHYLCRKKSTSSTVSRAGNSATSTYRSRKCEVVDFVAISFSFLALSFQVLFGFFLFQFEQLICIFLSILLFMYFFSMGSESIQAWITPISRHKDERLFLSWLCFKCNGLNFGKRISCFFCAYPFLSSRCKAFFSCNHSEYNDQLWEPDRKKYFRTYHND